ncbi:isoprenoid biosynthesis glyoxalase ElbB [Pectobacterium parmentieri]|uniref:Glyoxalase n=1 Tax=Pectobacterium parmentieri TaxID=1905730 RepID=A0A8B3FIU7_PECPM|nr:isoprenoid biosynthesis glyoxalase ElbB [Pectobacterium parmentieri]AOR60543.1 isoprenoid biosynthesis protein ElbB [Pectobacterium parmentieri]AYH03695.1 isoprenoid biosynthesis protein ElbB [Pectobacterium parmentieri]AYH12500.1 isoprenoid biosynthesis protein ElbB [Pectobacterium parmentieri]AYH21410.1 isoprenoid biosynthesis protein ElbB [Pectobacterium parmentieri]AYH29954.1 isoprenoid biosynthesis protein ElbB [Pectobacterium parmentieri]
MKRVGIVLSGCGVYDGSEIHEAVLTLLALDRAGAQAVCFAPDKPQLQVVNHLTGDVTGENRNVLAESARIARGNVQPLSTANAQDLDALIVPGGFGAVKNLSDFSTQGSACQIDKTLQLLTQEIYKQSKPIGLLCISPVLLPKILGIPVRVTIGNDIDTAEAVEEMGGIHVVCPVDDIVVDEEHKIVTTPAYMLANSISEAAQGIDKLVARVLDLIE